MGTDFGREPKNAETAMVAALVELHRRKRDRSRRQGPAGEQASILEYFERRGQRLRGEKLVTTEVVERLFATRAALPPRRIQQELEIVGPAGGKAAGRVRIVNRSAAAARFELVIGDPIDGEAPPSIKLEPPAGVLEAGQAGLVRVEAVLRGWRPGDRLTVPIECRWREGTDRLWLVISADAPGGESP